MSLQRLNLLPWDSDDTVYWFHRAEGTFQLCKNSAGTATTNSLKDKLSLAGTAIPTSVMKKYKAHVMKDDWEGFKEAVCSAMAKTDIQLFNEILKAKVQHSCPQRLRPSTKIQAGHALSHLY